MQEINIIVHTRNDGSAKLSKCLIIKGDEIDKVSH